LRGSISRSKKTLRAAEQDPVAREEWRKEVATIPCEQLVFVDETSTNIAMTRRYARSARGERAYGSVPRNHGTATTLVGALSLEGLGPAMVIEGAIDGASFTEYVRQLLCPSLRPGQVVLWDNLSAHKGEVVRELIEAAGCRLLPLPSYSPDFSPIEPGFSKIKESLRAAGARTQEALIDAIAEAIDKITINDAVGWFTHCGYPPVRQN
jgi:transposase